jgi:hypothetical protein
MSGEVNWKMKYQEIKAKWMDSLDMAFRAGFEEGKRQSELDNANQQIASQQQQMSGMQGQGMQGGAQPNAESSSEEMEPQQPDSQNPAGSELDQHIAKLESMVAKNEQVDVTALKETVNSLKKAQQSYLEQLSLAKSAKAIPAIAQALHKPSFKLSQQANHNLSSSAKQSVSMQEKIVTDLMKAWEDEEKKAGEDILDQLGITNHLKRE